GGGGPGAEQGGEPLRRGGDGVFADDGAVCLLDADLGFLLVHVHANIRHGWPPLRCGIDRVSGLWGPGYHVRVEAGRFTQSIFLASAADAADPLATESLALAGLASAAVQGRFALR